MVITGGNHLCFVLHDSQIYLSMTCYSYFVIYYSQVAGNPSCFVIHCIQVDSYQSSFVIHYIQVDNYHSCFVIHYSQVEGYHTCLIIDWNAIPLSLSVSISPDALNKAI